MKGKLKESRQFTDH